METILLHPENKEQLDAIKAVAKALKMRFEIAKSEVSPYNSDFVEKIQAGRADVEKRKGAKIGIEDLWK